MKVVLLALSWIAFCSGAELTFEVPDNAKECFYEEIQEGVETRIEFQVVSGGHYDIDVEVVAPDSQTLYKEVKQQYGNFQFKPQKTGVYQLCFSNEFSTFAHKTVYFDLQVGEEQTAPVAAGMQHVTVMTMMETLSSQLFSYLNQVIDYQTHHRLMETQGRKRAENLNETVLYWAVGESAAIVAIALIQVFILKAFFSDRNTIRVG